MAEQVYLPWVHSFEPKLAWLGDQIPEAISAVCHKLMFGLPAANDLVDVKIEFGLSLDYGIKLADSVPNTLNMLVVSDRLRALIDATSEKVEFYPARIRNLKGRLATEGYFIANPIGWIDCMDRKRSDYDPHPMERDQVLTFRTLVLDHSKIPEDRRLFRLASQKQLVLVRKDLAYEIYRVHELRGMIFQTLESFGEDFR